MEGKRYEILEQKMCKELEILENKYQANAGEMSIQDLDKIDKLYHALKSMATYNAMKEAEDYGEGGMSGRRGRSPMTGRYVSRDAGESFAEGYDRGYSEAMSRNQGKMDGNSGHYPMNPYYPGRW